MNKDTNMLLTLLLVARVGCEWVQISQQNYRKPFKPAHQYSLTTDVIRDKEDYENHSIFEYKWNKEPDSNSPSHLEQVPQINILHQAHQLENIKENPINEVKMEGPSAVERVSHIGRVDRVQLINTSVISSNIKSNSNFESTKEANNNLRQKLKTSNNNLEIEQSYTDTNIKLGSGHLKSIYNSESHEEMTEQETYTVPKPVTTENESIEVFNSNQFQRIPDVMSQNVEAINYRNQYQNAYSKRKVEAINSLQNVTTTDNDHLKHTETINKQETTTEKTVHNNEKSDAIKVIVKFMKEVSDTISSNTRRSFTSKVQYLEDLKDIIMVNIEDRIDATWTDNSVKRARRSQPGNDARGHVEFPSSESTLMSISFLTFAVFLIKLVLQVIQTYKNKTMMVAPLVVATAGRAALNQIRKMKHN